MNKPIRALLSIFLTAAIIILAAWLPKAMFGGTKDEPAAPRATDKESPVGIMRAEYLSRALMTSERFLYEDYAEADPAMRAKAMQTINDFLIKTEVPNFLYDEMKNLADSANIQSLSINTKGGAKLPVIRMFLQWQVNWNNWIDVYIDGDSGKILYLYASGSCINQVKTDETALVPSLDLIASVFSEHSGYKQLGSERSTNPDENAINVLFTDGTANEEYKINLIYYPGTMYDLKIAPLP